jgi:hypothetical protein
MVLTVEPSAASVIRSTGRAVVAQQLAEWYALERPLAAATASSSSAHGRTLEQRTPRGRTLRA